jgi:hypothetical protein
MALAEETDVYSPENLKSPQELALIQSSRGEEGISKYENPYTPMALGKGATLGNVRDARRRINNYARGFYFGLEVNSPLYKDIQISVEEIDDKGNTIADPVPFNEDGTPMDSSLWHYSENFPFRRV